MTSAITASQNVLPIAPLHLALLVCATLAVFCGVWLLIAFSNLCCCLGSSRHADPESGDTDKDQDKSSAKQKSTVKDKDRHKTEEGAGGATGGGPQPIEEPVRAKVAVKTETGKPTLEKKKKGDKKNGVFAKKEQKKGSGQSTEKTGALKDRISQFESQEPQPSAHIIRVKDGTKPKKKKPTSKAFQEFETKGILIGFGNAPRHRKSSEELLSEEGEEDLPGSRDDLQTTSSREQLEIQLPGLVSGPRKEHSNSTSHTNSLSRLTDDEGIHTMDEEDEFAAVARSSEVLKSFRRAPPPKNRAKARPLRKRIHDRHNLQGIPGLDFPLEMDEDEEAQTETESEARPTPSHSTDSIGTPSSRGTPDDDTGTSGHLTGEDSPRGDSINIRGATPDSVTEGSPNKQVVFVTQEYNLIRDESQKREYNNKTLIDNTTNSDSGKASKKSRLNSNEDDEERTANLYVVQTAPESADHGGIKRPKLSSSVSRDSTKESSPQETSNMTILPVTKAEDIPCVVDSPSYTSTTRVFLKTRQMSTPEHPNMDTKSILKNPSSVTTKTRHSSLSAIMASDELPGGNSNNDAKLVLTRPRSFHPTNFSRSRSRDHSPWERRSPSKSVDYTGRGRIFSTGQERAKSAVLGSPKFLRKWDSELSGLSPKLKRSSAIEHQGSGSLIKDVPDSVQDDKKRQLQPKWETAI